MIVLVIWFVLAAIVGRILGVFLDRAGRLRDKWY